MDTTLTVRVWHQQSKSHKQVWRCAIGLANQNEQGVVGMSDTEYGAVQDALSQLMPEHVLPRHYEVNVQSMVREAPRQSLEAVQYEYVGD